jgi:hypothetical protein
MGFSDGDGKLNQSLKKHYSDSKSDLSAVFIEKCRDMIVNNRFLAMMT